MPYDMFGAAQQLLQGTGSLISSQQSAKGLTQSAAAYRKAAMYSQAATSIKEQMATRQIYQVIGGARADVAASGLAETGSAEDVMRSSAQQGALTKALIATQGSIDYTSYIGQAQAAEAQASATKTSGTFGFAGSVVGALGSMFSDDRLKDNIELLYRREDGIGIYRYRYEGIFYEGVIASDVEKVSPEAVHMNDNGFKMVDYDAIGVGLRLSGSIG